MALRATKRGSERTPLDRDCDILICGASFAGLTLARELEGSGASVLMIDRYEVGERQTSACAAPTEWLENLALEDSIKQTFQDLLIHTPYSDFRYELPWTFSTFDYRLLCATLREHAPSTEFETAKVEGRDESGAVLTDRGPLRAPIVVDALGWRRVLSSAKDPIQPPNARLSRGLEVHPHGTGKDLELWIDPKYVRAGYGWNFPAGDEVRVGIGSFEPRDHVKDSTVKLAYDLGVGPDGYQGNWIPHQLRPAVDTQTFFVGDSAGHCLPLSAEGIRTAFYFAIALGRELRLHTEGRLTREQALARYGAFSEAHAWQYRWMLRVQHLVGATTGTRTLSRAIGVMSHKALVDWSFTHYLNIAHPSFALASTRDVAPHTQARAAA